MGKEQSITRNGYNLFEISSLLQKAIRRMDKKMAYFAAYELIPRYRNYLWKRLLVVSAEDCYDMLTGTILRLANTDDHLRNREDYSTIVLAVSILLNARKNRDADYFACNLLNSRDKKDLREYCEETFDANLATKNGHNIVDLTDIMSAAIDTGDDVTAGYCANEIRVYYRAFCWRRIIEKADSFGIPSLTEEIVSLCQADERTERSSTIYYSKALTILLKVAKYGGIDQYVTKFASESVNLEDYNIAGMRLPNYVYDCHTVLGKIWKKTKQDFVVAEQRALTPHVFGEYDNASWEHFFWLSENGFFREEYTPHPPKEVVDEIEKYDMINKLF